MGKLHTLRRAIEREPEKWFNLESTGRCWAYGASRRIWSNNNRWEPTAPWGYHGKAYRSFVKQVLKELGYELA